MSNPRSLPPRRGRPAAGRPPGGEQVSTARKGHSMKQFTVGTLAVALIMFVGGCGNSADSIMGELVQIQDEVADLASGMKDVAAVEAARSKFETLARRTVEATKKLLSLKGVSEKDMEAAEKKYEA